MLVIDWIAFGERVHVARRRLQLSQLQLAEGAGISRNYVSLIERGLADPGYAIVVSICEYLQIDLPSKAG